MKFVADEGVDFQIVSKLRNEGHDVAYIAEYEAGVSDETIHTIANHENRKFSPGAYELEKYTEVKT
ncbi:MAG: DUF5615 family PIN-like protein [Cyclobacteriaceae bacterium]